MPEAVKYLTQANFPNSTNLYAWHINGTSDYDDGDYVGTKALTENGALAAGTDHTGTSTFNVFDGSADYLSSTDAAFNATGDFTVGIWAYRADWSTNFTGSNQAFICNNDGAAGWAIQGVNASTNVRIFCILSSSFTINSSWDASGLAAGWHHFLWVHDSGTSDKLYVDNDVKINLSDTSNTFTAYSQFNIGASHTGSNLFNGRLSEAFVHFGETYTDLQVKQLYNGSVRQYVNVT